MRKILLFVFTFFFFIHSHAFADGGWIIDSFNSDIHIQKNGVVHVEERIKANFGNLEKHGIYRDIPFRYTNEDGTKYYTEIKNITTGSDQKDVEKEGDFVRIRIGDPDNVIRGKKEYVISYEVVGVLRGFKDYDELYWNVTGNNWPIPITHATAHVSIEGTELINTACYQGSSGSTDSCHIKNNNNKTVSFLMDPLSSYQGVTIVVTYPKNVIVLPMVKSFGQRLLSPLSIATLLVTLAAGIGGILVLWHRNGRDYTYIGTNVYEKNKKVGTQKWRRRIPIVVEYTPPESLRPAEIGVLMDEKADTLDVTSTIVDLATRGFLTITEEKKKWVFGKHDYTLKKKEKDISVLNVYEKKLYEELFADGDTVAVSSLKKTFYDELAAVKKQLYTDVVNKGFFPQSPESTRHTYLGIGIGIVVLVSFLIGFAVELENEYLVMVIAGLILTGLNFIVVSRAMPRRSAKGNELYRRVLGYRMFIENVETYRQQFFERKNMFNEVLPYAMVFGLTEKFAQGLEKIGYVSSNPTWYHGAGHFTPTHFQSNISSFSSSLSSAMVSTPSSSGSGFSGGSSGGGFGGGGGGSW